MSVQITNYQNLADKQRRGYQAISLDSLITTAAVTIKSGSVVEVAGALYEFQADETESGGTWAGIGNSNVVYIYIVPAGSTATFIYSVTAPTWDSSKQGWYNGTSRAVVSLYKDAGGLYQSKYLLPSSQSSPLPGGARNIIKTSGALGTIAVTGDIEYILTAASTVTLPPGAPLGCRITFKNKGNFTTTISGNGSQTIGTTTSTSFSLYAQEDYVTLEWDGVSIWYVVATNGPILRNVITSIQTQTSPVNGTWYNKGGTLALAPGVYELSWSASLDVILSSGTGCVFATLSTGAASETDIDFSVGFYFTTVTEANGPAFRKKIVTLATSPTYYLNIATLYAALSISFYGAAKYGNIIIEAKRIG
jgi:hypothetical protein